MNGNPPRARETVLKTPGMLRDKSRHLKHRSVCSFLLWENQGRVLQRIGRPATRNIWRILPSAREHLLPDGAAPVSSPRLSHQRRRTRWTSIYMLCSVKPNIWYPYEGRQMISSEGTGVHWRNPHFSHLETRNQLPRESSSGCD